MLNSTHKLNQIKRSIVILDAQLENLRTLVHELELEIDNDKHSPKNNTHRQSRKRSTNSAKSSSYKQRRAEALGRARAWAKATYGDKCH